MARLGVHPRFAHMVLASLRLGCPELACVLASLLSERDVLRGREVRSADVMLRLRALAAADLAVDRATATRILESAKKMLGQLQRQGDGEGAGGDLAPGSEMTQTQDLDEQAGDEAEEAEEGISPPGNGSGSGAAAGSSSPPQLQRWVEQLQRDAVLGVLLALAYPDRIAQRVQRGSARAAYTLSLGRNARLLEPDDPLQLSEFIAIAELGGGKDGRNDVVQLAAGLSKSAIDR
jgi:ATP-dependent helicase HrpB